MAGHYASAMLPNVFRPDSPALALQLPLETEQALETACAEAGYWRLKFWNESAFLSKQSKSIPVTLFEFQAATKQALDLSRPPLVEDRAIWTHPDDYSGTKALAGNARQANAEVLRYESVRCLNGRCLVILSPAAFQSIAEPQKDNQQTWNLLIKPPHQLVWQRELSQECWTFDF